MSIKFNVHFGSYGTFHFDFKSEDTNQLKDLRDKGILLVFKPWTYNKRISAVSEIILRPAAFTLDWVKEEREASNNFRLGSSTILHKLKYDAYNLVTDCGYSAIEDTGKEIITEFEFRELLKKPNPSLSFLWRQNCRNDYGNFTSYRNAYGTWF